MNIYAALEIAKNLELLSIFRLNFHSGPNENILEVVTEESLMNLTDLGPILDPHKEISNLQSWLYKSLEKQIKSLNVFSIFVPQI